MQIAENTLKTLQEVAQAVGAQQLVKAIEQISTRQAQKDCALTLPLVGEFSAGKTSLLNALTDTKALETAVLPTTATLFEVHFGCPTAYAEVLSDNGKTQRVSDIASLKNSQLGSARHGLRHVHTRFTRDCTRGYPGAFSARPAPPTGAHRIPPKGRRHFAGERRQSAAHSLSCQLLSRHETRQQVHLHGADQVRFQNA